eukprot:TRINITY_DN60932_c0_g1_i1.p1 TRINITY_DN60932_c0_g1~~TRINITY_DN60932_c0_g1_i1.p1  ORF type:complete len:322 (-),score=45.69 TRINITY_DN60932_c0_g1_i1:51-1016(-)
MSCIESLMNSYGVGRCAGAKVLEAIPELGEAMPDSEANLTSIPSKSFSENLGTDTDAIADMTDAAIQDRIQVLEHQVSRLVTELALHRKEQDHATDVLGQLTVRVAESIRGTMQRFEKTLRSEMDKRCEALEVKLSSERVGTANDCDSSGVPCQTEDCTADAKENASDAKISPVFGDLTARESDSWETKMGQLASSVERHCHDLVKYADGIRTNQHRSTRESISLSPSSEGSPSCQSESCLESAVPMLQKAPSLERLPPMGMSEFSPVVSTALSGLASSHSSTNLEETLCIYTSIRTPAIPSWLRNSTSSVARGVSRLRSC